MKRLTNFLSSLPRLLPTKLLFYPWAVVFFSWLLLSAILSLPLILFQFGNPANNRRYGNYYAPIARFLLGMKVDVEGWENWRKELPGIYVANHQSMIDMSVFTVVLAPDAALIGKREILYVPIWGLMFAAFGNILINRKNRAHSIAGLKEAVEAIKNRKRCIFILPEGTRSQAPGLLPFKKGAFHMAIEAQVPLLPLVCATQSPFYNLREARVRKATIGVEILPAIPTVGLTLEDVPALMERTRTEMLKALDRANARSKFR